MIVCPHCKATLETDIRNVGQKAKCQNCGGSFVINDIPTRIDLGLSHTDKRSKSTHKIRWHIPNINWGRLLSCASKVVEISILGVIAYLMFDLTRQSQKLSDNVSVLTTKIRSVASDVDSIEFDVGRIKSDISSSEADISRIETNISSIESDVSWLRIHGIQIDR